MQVNLLSQDNWKHRHNCTKPGGKAPPYPAFGPSIDTPSPGDRRPGPLDHPSSNSTAFNPTQQDMLALQTQPGNSRPGVQESEAAEEIAPEDIKYRLQPLPKAPLQLQSPSYSSQHSRPQWLPFSTTCGECYKPGRTQPVTDHEEKPSHSGDDYVTPTHQISLQSPLLGHSMFPVHIQGRKIAPIVRPGFTEHISQYQSDFQASGWNQVLKTDPDKRSQGINKYIQTVQKDAASGWQPTMQRHPKRRWLKQEMTIFGRKSIVKFDGDTVTQDCRTQPQECDGHPHHRGYEQPLRVGSQAPTQDQTTTRTSYMPLFSERLNLCKPKVNSIKREPNTISLLSEGKHSDQSSCLKAASRNTSDNKTQNSKRGNNQEKETAQITYAKMHGWGPTSS
ncbi:uncharacterized protein LOC120230010 isoform X3 [Hyaena hyaena]|nr:uncharacterized protein LOC120230010 isoform X3 [Hyaena hyaena]